MLVVKIPVDHLEGSANEKKQRLVYHTKQTAQAAPLTPGKIHTNGQMVHTAGLALPFTQVVAVQRRTTCTRLPDWQDIVQRPCTGAEYFSMRNDHVPVKYRVRQHPRGGIEICHRNLVMGT